MGKDGGHGFEDKPRPGGLGQSKGIHGWKDGQPGQNGYGRIDGDNDQRVGNDVALFVQIAAKNKGGGNADAHGKEGMSQRVQRHLNIDAGKIRLQEPRDSFFRFRQA